MRNSAKRLLSALLLVAMLVGLFPTNVLAEEASDSCRSIFTQIEHFCSEPHCVANIADERLDNCCKL